MVTVIEPGGREDWVVRCLQQQIQQMQLNSNTYSLSYSLETVHVVGSEEAVEINGVFSSSGDSAHVLLPLTDHGPLQQAGALQGQL